MRILILGANKLGLHMANSLESEGHEITLLAEEKGQLSFLPKGTSVKSKLLHRSLSEGLSESGATKTDILLAITENDHINAFAAQLATSVFNVEKVFCRIDDPSRGMLYKTLGLNVMSTTSLIEESILSQIHPEKGIGNK